MDLTRARNRQQASLSWLRTNLPTLKAFHSINTIASCKCNESRLQGTRSIIEETNLNAPPPIFTTVDKADCLLETSRSSPAEAQYLAYSTERILKQPARYKPSIFCCLVGTTTVNMVRYQFICMTLLLHSQAVLRMLPLYDYLFTSHLPFSVSLPFPPPHPSSSPFLYSIEHFNLSWLDSWLSFLLLPQSEFKNSSEYHSMMAVISFGLTCKYPSGRSRMLDGDQNTVSNNSTKSETTPSICSVREPMTAKHLRWSDYYIPKTE